MGVGVAVTVAVGPVIGVGVTVGVAVTVKIGVGVGVACAKTRLGITPANISKIKLFHFILLTEVRLIRQSPSNWK
jgi:hypothetical protein